MGVCGMPNRCLTNTKITTAPNPSPSRWTILEKAQFRNGYILIVKYHDCTNFEGIKIMVYHGEYTEREILDPHFDENSEHSPVARFAPTTRGKLLAIQIAKSL